MFAPARVTRAETPQLSFFEGRARRPRRAREFLCARCQSKEARYGFREADEEERPSTLCFECFRLELTKRQEAARRSRESDQRSLPLTPDRASRIARSIASGTSKSA